MIPGVRAEVFRPILLIIFAIIILVGLYLSIKQSKVAERGSIEILSIGLAFVVVLYVAVLLIIYSVSTETISIDDRMLSPLIAIIYGWLLSCALVLTRRIHPRITFPILGVIIALFFVAFNTPSFKAYPVVVGNYPNGYTSPVWKENPILTTEVTLPQGRALITNAPDIVLFYLNRSAYPLTTHADAAGSSLSIDGQTSLDDMIHKECAVLVMFHPDKVQQFEKLADSVTLADIASLQNQLDTVYSSANGTILVDNNCSK
ncbi:MAG: hypothetical protein C0410_10535 [Anaerolinea sp.]|nr:hypothetical protein [Anaerolinea sp.]